MPAIGSSSSIISGSSAKRRSDFQRALAPVRHFHRRRARELGEPDIGKQLVRAIVQRIENMLRAPEIEGSAARALQADADILKRGEMRKHRRNLERANKPEPRDVGRFQRGDVAALIDDAPARRIEELGEQIEAGRFAGAVRPDQGMDRPALDAQINIPDRRKAGEFLRQALGDEDIIVTHA